MVHRSSSLPTKHNKILGALDGKRRLVFKLGNRSLLG